MGIRRSGECDVGDVDGADVHVYGENRQISATVNGVAATYAYDGEGHRVYRSVGGVGTYYAYDAMGNLVVEYGPPTGDSGTVYLTADTVGSTRLVTDAGGAPKLCYDYMPFGSELGAGINTRPSNCFVSDAFNTKFTGMERDSESGLDNMIARYFSSAQGRFMGADGPFNIRARVIRRAGICLPMGGIIRCAMWTRPGSSSLPANRMELTTRTTTRRTACSYLSISPFSCSICLGERSVML